MKCLLKYPWVKLPRDRVPSGKGLMGSWMRLAARAAFRKGEGHYCGYDNPVLPGMWVGGIVGLKSILGIPTLWQRCKPEMMSKPCRAISATPRQLSRWTSTDT